MGRRHAIRDMGSGFCGTIAFVGAGTRAAIIGHLKGLN
jgi:hypothetical protein